MERPWSRLRIPAALLAGLVFLGGLAGLLRVQAVTTPSRTGEAAFDFEAFGLPVEAVRFEATDGVVLSGAFLPGTRAQPPVILCHDWNTSRSSMASVAIALHEAGFPTLAFDFRAHGESEGGRSTLGVEEKRDVLGAVDYLLRESLAPTGRIGIYGVGMGAHAAVLAAEDRRQVKVLVLDGLYPDSAYPLARRFYSGWSPGVDHLPGLPTALLAGLTGAGTIDDRAEDALRRLVGRDLLLLAPAADPGLVDRMRSMQAGIPQRRDTEGNMMVLPATAGVGLFGNALGRYHEEVVLFFGSRLRDDPPPSNLAPGPPDN